MNLYWSRLLLLGGLLSLGGCVASMAAGALGMAVRGSQGQSNQHLGPAARQACSNHAAQYGAVNIIDVEQRSPSRIIVWGAVDDGRERRSFECAYGTRITNFRLRAIPPSR
jgi:hypothetical protein